MRIKRLEIYGFKSFPHKVVLPFPPGISAIVGPNGSGKSNVLDALRWVLGEQNPRRLRVREMADVLFAGGNGRAPAFAEVRLVLDNEDGKAPKGLKDLPEIAITRRLYRQGDSEYLLNNRPCRLKDIVYLFLDTGAHPRAYGLIDQGQVGQFVEYSPKERRVFLEELAGMARYKLRREETNRQLQRSRDNLVRLKDILVEVERREAELEHQAEEARAYLSLQEELRQVEIQRWALALKDLQGQKRQVEKAISRDKERFEALLARQRQISPEFEEVAAHLELLRQEVSSLEESLSRIQADLRKRRRQLEDLLHRQAELERRRERWEADLLHRKERLEALHNRLRELRDDRQKRQGRLGALEEELAQIKDKIQAHSQKRRLLETQLKQCQQELIKIRQELGRFRERLNSLEQEKEKIIQRQRETDKALALVHRQRQDLLLRREEGEKELKAQETQQVKIENSLKAVREELSRLKGDISEVQEERRFIKFRLKEVRHEAAFLEHFLETEAVPEAVKRIKEAGYPCKTLAQELSLPPQEEQLAEWVLGDELLAVLAEDKTEVLKLATLLKEQDLGGHILWVKGPLPDWVKRRLHEAKVVEDLEQALRADFWAFTPDGFSVCPDGLVSYRPRRKEPGILQRQRRLKELQEEIKNLEERDKDLLAKEQRLKELLFKIQKEEKDLAAKLVGLKKQLEEKRRLISDLELKITHLEEKQSFYQTEQQRLGQERAEITVRKETIQKKIDDLVGREQELQAQEEQLSQELSSLRRHQHHIFEAERRLELELSGLREAIRRAKAEEERVLKEQVREQKAREQIQGRLTELGNEINELLAQLQSVRAVLQDTERQAEAIEATYKDKKAKFKEFELKNRALTKEREELRLEIDKLKERLHRKEIDLTEIELKISHLLGRAEEAYGVNLEDIEVTSKSPKDLDSRRGELKEALRRYQAVNLAAIEELEKVRERREFLLSQRSDLEKAIVDLEQAVKRINKTCRERLREALVQANTKLAEIFPLLFPGGRAELKFVGSEDPLEAGLDLEIKLPGKPIRHLAMLSGGEKALTALAVLCAFYLVKPGPFCVLDEVDAPLDEANTERFLGLLKEMAKHAQIILVTHNRRVMEAAEALFGLTMEEKGVSKVVSVRLTDMLEAQDSSLP